MLLRRVIENVKSQNWTAIVLDFVIVVVGVFIGIQVANWNEAREDRQREAQYLENLADDISAEIVVLEEVQHSLEVRSSVIGKLIKESLGVSLPDVIKSSLAVKTVAEKGEFAAPVSKILDQLNHDNFLSYAVFARIFSEKNSTFTTLQATGDFSLIRDRDLAQGIADYYAILENLKHLENGTIRQMRDHAALLSMRHGHNPFGENDYELILETIGKDSEFTAALRTLRNISATNYVLALSAKEEAKSILSKLHRATKETRNSKPGT